MAGVTCLALLSCIWEPIQATLLSFLGTTVADSLSSLRDCAVRRFRNSTLFWGNRVEQVPISSADLVGMEEIRVYLQQIASYLNDDGIGVFGVYGEGGVGKTTLLAMINNKFPQIGAPGFEVVIWVTVSKDPSISKIQKSICERISSSSLSSHGAGSSSQAEEDDAKAIFKVLSKRRFLLLLDDVWEALELRDVGIPQPTSENRCKIILTTRSKQVCTNMGAKALVRVHLLNEMESWKLFKGNVHDEVNLDGPLINPHAKAVARKCGGLPLALITVGRAMAEANSVGEWMEALEQLNNSPHEIPGMEKVLSLLKFSFDRLGNPSIKECLLYCCLFPEDYEIYVEELIEYWVGEGFLDHAKSDSILRARNRGYAVITKLKSVCLLESAARGRVKMHDVVREMCLWLTGGQFDSSNTFLVCTGKGSNHASTFESWANAKRLTLIHTELGGLPRKVPSCPNLQTWLTYPVYATYGPYFHGEAMFERYAIQGGVFEFMPALRVLDLSFVPLMHLSDDIGLLANLRYLNLRQTRIKSLPKGLGKLANLRQLDLDYTFSLTHVPREVIPTLTGLRALGLFESTYELGYLDKTDDKRYREGEGTSSSSSSSSLASIKDNNESCWDKLEELRLTTRMLSSLETLLNSDMLSRCNIDLQIVRCSDIIPAEHLSAAFRRLEKLRLLHVRDESEEMSLEVRFDSGSKCRISLEELYLHSVSKITVAVASSSFFKNLRVLMIVNCHGIHDLSDMVRQAPCLERIEMLACKGIKELLSMDGVGGAASSGDGQVHDCDGSSLMMLKTMVLSELPALKSISERPLLLPSLEYLGIRDCPQVKKIPLGPFSAKNIQTIRADKGWWEGLEWHRDEHGQSVEPLFLPHLRA